VIWAIIDMIVITPEIVPKKNEAMIGTRSMPAYIS